MKQVTFYYCVHGETLFNRAKRMQGWCDSPLTDNGRNQMMEAAGTLKSIPFSAAYASTSECCRDSVEILMKGRDIAVTYLKSLKEEFYGTMEGVLISSKEEEIEAIRKARSGWSRYGGESEENIRQRAKEIFSKIYDRCSDMDRILIVSHNEFLLDVMNVLMGISYEKLDAHYRGESALSHGLLSVFSCRDGQWELLSVTGLDSAGLRSLKAPLEKRLKLD